MANYSPNTWTTGDTITKTKIDRLEAGAAAALPSADAPELIRDTMGTALVAGSNMTITPNDGGDTITLAATGGSGSVDPRTATLDRSHGEMWRGLSVRGWAAGIFNSAMLRADAMAKAAEMSCDTIQMTVNVYQDTLTSTAITRVPVGVPELRSYIQYVKAQGYRVFFKHHQETENSGTEWRGEMQPTNVNTWFTNYQAQTLIYAQLCQDEGVELFSVGTEYVWLAENNPQKWRDVIAAVRGIYKGPITYGASGSTTDGDEYHNITFWDDLDYIGVDIYPAMDYDPAATEAEIAAYMDANAFGQDAMASLDAVARKYGKGVIATEYGIGPNVPDPPSGGQNPTWMAALMKAMLTRLYQQPWYRGGFLWAIDDGAESMPLYLGTGTAVPTAIGKVQRTYQYATRDDAGPLGPAHTWRSGTDNVWCPIATVAAPREFQDSWVRLSVYLSAIGGSGDVYLGALANDTNLAAFISCEVSGSLPPSAFGYTVAAGVVTLWARTGNGELVDIRGLQAFRPGTVDLTNLGSPVTGAPAGMTFAVPQMVAPVDLTDGATVQLNAAWGSIFRLAAGGNRTIAAPTNPTDGQRISIEVTASGAARTITLATGAAGAFKFGTTVTALSQTVSGATDIIECRYRDSASRWWVTAYTKGL